MRLLVGVLTLFLVQPVHAQWEAAPEPAHAARAKAQKLKRTGMYLLAFGAGALATSALGAGVSGYLLLGGGCPTTSPRCHDQAYVPGVATSMTMLAVGAVALVSGIGVFMDGKKRMNQLELERPALSRGVRLDGIGLAPLLASGRADGAMVQVGGRF